MKLKKKIDELSDTMRGDIQGWFVSMMQSTQGQELLRWVAEQAIKNHGCKEVECREDWPEICLDEDWWKTFSEDL